MEIRFFLSFSCVLFVILNVSKLYATVQQQTNFVRVCGKPSQAAGLIIRGKDFKRGEFPWTVALLNKGKNPAEFFGAGTLISTRHVITGMNQNQISPSFGDKK